MIELHTLAAEPEVLELGDHLSRSQWDRDVATDASAAVMAYGVALAGPGCLGAGYKADNAASARVLASSASSRRP